ncbi:MAG: 16S rRNA (guanine(966)-N(2))-methyltransferase RsmD [Christensenellales bacterium]|jgi:16S rRNA (guanine966-N2)-methyltransferase
MAIRILGGKYRSRLLRTPSGYDTRPTRAMVREAVFNMLQGRVQHASVLDVFAGTGAMGFEALSRGAEEVVFCDRRREAVEAIRINAQILGCERQICLLQGIWQTSLSRLGKEESKFDLIFLDPPYKMEVLELLGSIVKEGLLHEEGLVVLEQGSQEDDLMPVGYEIFKQRRYGSTRIYLLKPGS